MTKQTESQIQSAILEYLTLKGHYHFRVNSGTTFMGGRAIKLAPPGTPDIVVCDKAGFFVGLEVKKPGGKQSKVQKENEERIKAANGEYYIVKSVDDVIEIGL